jgi:hypothetical protein
MIIILFIFLQYICNVFLSNSSEFKLVATVKGRPESVQYVYRDPLTIYGH